MSKELEEAQAIADIQDAKAEEINRLTQAQAPFDWATGLMTVTNDDGTTEEVRRFDLVPLGFAKGDKYGRKGAVVSSGFQVTGSQFGNRAQKRQQAKKDGMLKLAKASVAL